jgi:RNA polymerase sigma-70 factor (ECF subfamily)
MPERHEVGKNHTAEDQRVDEDQLIDIQLVQEAKGGDADAFGTLFERHGEAVFRFLYSHLDSRQDAEDITNDVFMRVWRSLPSYKEKGVPFIAYLFRVARNALIDHYRRSTKAEHSSLDDRVIQDARPDPGELALIQIEREEIRHMLDQLKDDYRMVLTLRFLGDLSPDETGEVMGKSSGAVRVLQHRALAALRKIMGS